MRDKYKLAPIGLALAAGLAISACGSAEPKSTAGAGALDVRVLQTVDYDYEPAATPQALAGNGEIHVIAKGLVDRVDQGPSDAASGERSVILRATVTDRLKDTAGGVKDGRVSVRLHQDPAYSLADMKKAIPAGTPVMVFGASPEKLVAGEEKQLPPELRGQGLLEPHPQGLIFENAADGKKIVGGLETFEGMNPAWKKVRTLDELVTMVAK